MSKIHTNAINARFIIVSPKYFIRPLAKAIILIFACFLDKYKQIIINVDLLRALKMFE